MSNVPRTDDLPRTPGGYDAARVEEAFSAFADRVRELEEVAGELRAELQTLRAERPAAAAPPPRVDDERWPVEAGAHPSPDWVAAVPPPLARGFTVPRLALEGAFLLLVALCAGLADLSAEWIVIVMVAAWTLVALSEWAAAAKRARWHLDEIAPPLAADAADTTGPWDMPVVQATVVESAPDPESKTIVTKLPADPGEDERSRRPRRRRPRSAAAASGGASRPPRRAPPIPGRRELLAAAVAAAALVVVPGASALRPAPALKVCCGLVAELYATGLKRPTALAFGPDGLLYATQETGEVVAVGPGSSAPRVLARGFETPLGLTWVGRNLFVSAQGYVSRLVVRGRQVVSRRKIVTRLPFDRHQQDTIVLGPDGRLYLGSGSTCDVCKEKDARSGAILSFQQDGSGLRIVARGLRNPFGLIFDGDTLYVSDNARDDLGENEPAETIVRIRPGADYGWPRCWASWRLRKLQGSCRGVTPPVAYLEPHSSANSARALARAGWSSPSGASTWPTAGAGSSCR